MAACPMKAPKVLVLVLVLVPVLVLVLPLALVAWLVGQPWLSWLRKLLRLRLMVQPHCPQPHPRLVLPLQGLRHHHRRWQPPRRHHRRCRHPQENPTSWLASLG